MAKTAGAIPTTKFLKPSRTANGCTTSYAPFFCDYVYRVMRTDPAFGATPSEREALLRRGGLTITTTLDPAVQKAAQKAVDKRIPRKDKSRKVAAISMVRPTTGEIVAMAQNRSWGVKGRGNTTYNFNVGTELGGSLGAQAGSTFKAFTLAAALREGLSPYERIESPQTKTFKDFSNCKTGVKFPPYRSNNSTGSGTFNMITGTAFSVNTYFMGARGEDRPVQAGRDRRGPRACAGATASRSTACPSFTLGTDEVTPLAMAGAYGTFANHGTRCQSIAIAR